MDYSKFPKLIALSESMRRFEGGGPGKNNPGNIKCPTSDRNEWNHYAIGSTDDFCDFPSNQVGIIAHLEKLYNICIGVSKTYCEEAQKEFFLTSSSELSIYQMIQIYAPIGDGNDPEHYAITVCGWANLLTSNTMVSLLSNSVSTINIIPVSSPQINPPLKLQNINIPISTTSLWNSVLEWIISIFKSV